MTVQAFAGTTVPLDKSMVQVKKLLNEHGVFETRYTETGTPDEGQLIYEFVHGADESRRGVRVNVTWASFAGPKGGRKGSTSSMAGRALFWFLKSKFDSIDYGIEEFDVAFMPHLMTQLGPTFAEQPDLIGQVILDPSALSLAVPPAHVLIPERAE
jgi:hypothetical protein